MHVIKHLTFVLLDLRHYLTFLSDLYNVHKEISIKKKERRGTAFSIFDPHLFQPQHFYPIIMTSLDKDTRPELTN